MKVRLLKDNGMEKARAGDIIEVDPAHGGFLICYGWAEAADAGEQAEAPEQPKKAEAEEPKQEKKPAAKAAAKKPAAKKTAAKK